MSVALMYLVQAHHCQKQAWYVCWFTLHKCTCLQSSYTLKTRSFLSKNLVLNLAENTLKVLVIYLKGLMYMAKMNSELLFNIICILAIFSQYVCIFDIFIPLKALPNTCNIIVAWCCHMCWMGWPNVCNLSMFMCPGPLVHNKCAHAVQLQFWVDVAKRVQHHATSKMLHEEFDRFDNWSNIIQRVATHHNRVAKRMQHVVPNHVARCCIWPGLNTQKGHYFLVSCNTF